MTDNEKRLIEEALSLRDYFREIGDDNLHRPFVAAADVVTADRRKPSPDGTRVIRDTVGGELLKKPYLVKTPCRLAVTVADEQ